MKIDALIYEELEKQTVYFNAETDRDTFLCSIAISLKRIADKLELSQKQPVLMSASEYKAYQASKKND